MNSEPQASNNPLPNIIIVLISFGIAFLVYIVGEQLIKNQAQIVQQKQAQNFLTLAESVADTTIKSLTVLNKLDLPQCDSEALVLMRREVFRSQYVKDLGMFKKDLLVCTTGLGELEEGFLEPPPDYISKDGISLWPNRKLLFFDQSYESIIIRLGQFNAVIDPDDFRSFITSDYIFEIVFKHEQNIVHILGQEDLYLIPQSSGADKDIRRYSQCSGEIPICISLQLKSGMLKENHRFGFRTLIIFSILTFVFLVVLGKIYLVKRYSLTTRIKRGLRKNRFFPEFQPLVELKTGKMIGCEVLARFIDSRGILTPDKFIPVIRKNHSTWKFTEKLIENSLSQLLNEDKLPNNFLVNFNIFPQDIANGNIERLLRNKTLLNSNIKIGLEITEDQALDINASTPVLKRLSDEGFIISIDDFGTGYSNLNQLKNLHCNTLKIDRSFINEMEDSSIRSTLIPHIVSIADKLNLKIVAEGIENKKQAEALIKEGVVYGQGWFYGRPVNANKLFK